MVKRNLFLSLLLILLMASVGAASEKTGTIVVNVTNLHNNEGQVCYGLFKNGEGFPTNFQKAFRTVTAPIVDLKSSAEFTDVPYGNYAIGVIHDQNNNNALDTLLTNTKEKAISGMEGYGVSNNVKEALLSASKYADAVFRLKTERRTVDIILQYSKY